jgi:hypothetical protein
MKLLVALLAISTTAIAADPRYCGEPLRTEAGAIKRSSSVLTQFKRLHPCPSTGKTTGACPGWAIDHVIPLASCGCDAVLNLQWLPNSIKSAAGVDAKDRWERKVYVCPVEIPDESLSKE